LAEDQSREVNFSLWLKCRFDLQPLAEVRLTWQASISAFGCNRKMLAIQYRVGLWLMFQPKIGK